MFLDSTANTPAGKDERVVAIMAAVFVIVGGLVGAVLLGGFLLKALFRSSGLRPRATLLPW
ncbi:MAG: hypothetical protein ACREUC_17650 [Steroidobacteraceae bacterium]